MFYMQDIKIKVAYVLNDDKKHILQELAEALHVEEFVFNRRPCGINM